MLSVLKSDPNKQDNLAGQEAVVQIEDGLHERALHDVDPDTVRASILASQRQLSFIATAAEYAGRSPCVTL